MHRLRFSIAALTLTAWIGGGTINAAWAESSSIANVSQTVFDCMKRNTGGVGGWIEYDGENSGRIEVYAAAVGEVGEVAYSLDTSQSALNLTYVGGQAPFAQIRNGLNDTANRCRSGELD